MASYKGHLRLPPIKESTPTQNTKKDMWQKLGIDNDMFSKIAEANTDLQMKEKDSAFQNTENIGDKSKQKLRKRKKGDRPYKNAVEMDNPDTGSNMEVANGLVSHVEMEAGQTLVRPLFEIWDGQEGQNTKFEPTGDISQSESQHSALIMGSNHSRQESEFYGSDSQHGSSESMTHLIKNRSHSAESTLKGSTHTISVKSLDVSEKQDYRELALKLASNYLPKPEERKYKYCDYILTYETDDSDLLHMNDRDAFESALSDENFELIKCVIGKQTFVELYCSFERLCQEAETIFLEMPLAGVSF